jgi:hypothetical protein
VSSTLRPDPTVEHVPGLLQALTTSHRRMNEVFHGRSDSWWHAPSALPDWSRLTIACHLRYVAEAMIRITEVAVQRQVAPMYPGGRDIDRPGSLQPREGETPSSIVESVRRTSNALEQIWAGVPSDMWEYEFTEADHGTLLFSRWLALRLTEVEVHCTDVGAHIGPDSQQWSASFVSAVLPLRVAWLTRARERPDANLCIGGTWTLQSPNQQWRVTSSIGSRVVEVNTHQSDHTGEQSKDSGTVLRGDNRTLLALLLGRDNVSIVNQIGPGVSNFKAAFPGP